MGTGDDLRSDNVDGIDAGQDIGAAGGIAASGASEPVNTSSGEGSGYAVPGSGAATERRAPGRPRGGGKPKSKAKRGGGSKVSPVRLRVEQGDRPPVRELPPPNVKTDAAGDIQSATLAAHLMLGSLEAMLVGVIGPEAQMSPTERPLIFDPAIRMLARSDANALAKYASILDPCMLGIGLCLYGARVYSTVRARKDAPARADDGRGASVPPAESVPAAERGASAASPVPHTGNEQTNGYAPVPAEILAAMESDQLGGF